MAKKKSIFSDDYDSALGQGVEVVHVADKQLATALISVGIRLRKDPPYVQVKKANGEIITTFNFLPQDDEGRFYTVELIKAWNDDLDFIEANPLHPFTFCMCQARNYGDILDHLAEDKPYVQFLTTKGGKRATLLVKEGSEKHQKALSRGLVQL